MRKVGHNAVLIGTVLIANAWCVAARPSFQGLGDMAGGAVYSEARGISADGRVVVGNGKSTTSGTSTEAFRWTAAGGMIGLGFLPGASQSAAEATSADGSVVVGQSGGQAYRWTQATGLVGLGDLPGGSVRSEAVGVSADGSVVVGSSKSANSTANWANEAYRWTEAGGMIGLGDLAGGYFDSVAMGVSADGQVVAGVSDRKYTMYEAYYGAFRWTPAGGMVAIGEMPGGDYYSWAWGMSGDGLTIVGSSDGGGSYYQAFRWTAASGMVSLGNTADGSLRSRTALAASYDGSVVVGKGGTSSGDQAFIWDAIHGMRKLRDVLTSDYRLDLTGWTLWEARSVSASGRTIVGNGKNPSGQIEAWLVVLGVAADFDDDGDVDKADFDALKDCWTGPAIPYAPSVPPDGCSMNADGDGIIPADFDRDRDVDLADFGFFQRCFSGANHPADPLCAK